MDLRRSFETILNAAPWMIYKSSSLPHYVDDLRRASALLGGGQGPGHNRSRRSSCSGVRQRRRDAAASLSPPCPRAIRRSYSTNNERIQVRRTSSRVAATRERRQRQARSLALPIFRPNRSHTVRKLGGLHRDSVRLQQFDCSGERFGRAKVRVIIFSPPGISHRPGLAPNRPISRSSASPIDPITSPIDRVPRYRYVLIASGLGSWFKCAPSAGCSAISGLSERQQADFAQPLECRFREVLSEPDCRHHRSPWQRWSVGAALRRELDGVSHDSPLGIGQRGIGDERPHVINAGEHVGPAPRGGRIGEPFLSRCPSAGKSPLIGAGRQGRLRSIFACVPSRECGSSSSAAQSVRLHPTLPSAGSGRHECTPDRAVSSAACPAQYGRRHSVAYLVDDRGA